MWDAWCCVNVWISQPYKLSIFYGVKFFLYICNMNKLKNIGLFIIGLLQAIGVYILFVFDNLSSILSIRTKPEFKSFYETWFWQQIALIRLLVFLLVYLAVIWLTKD